MADYLKQGQPWFCGYNNQKFWKKKKKMVAMFLHGIETELQTFHSLV